MDRTIAYASIRTGCKDNKDYSHLTQTRTYKEIHNHFQSMFFDVVEEKNFSIDGYDKNATLYVDVLLYGSDKHIKLDAIIHDAISSNEKIGILVTNINSFGNASQIKSYYHIFQQHNIYILCPDYNRLNGLSEYSTCDYSFAPLPAVQIAKVMQRIDSLSDNDLKENRGRTPSDYTDSFQAAYWLYESYQIPEKIAVAMSGHLKTAFHYKAANYELSGDFAVGLQRFAPPNIASIPKRYGKLPLKFHEIATLIDAKQQPVESIMDEICIDLHVPSIHPVNFMRFKLREELAGQSILKQYNNPDHYFIKKFKEYMDDGGDPTCFWNIYCHEIPQK